ncbi:MAG: rod shape-determining protein RodA [Pseudomonadota bacterium]|nr:rod shape-determining protein RodA [Pseudomonadota bacterium]
MNSKDHHNSGHYGSLTYYLNRIHLDPPLLSGIIAILIFGLFVLYSASGQDNEIMIRQISRLGFAIITMLFVAQIRIEWIRRLAPWLYGIGLLTLIMVAINGVSGGGAQRWLEIGIRFQPSELMKIAVPALMAWLLHERRLPPSGMIILAMLLIIILPVSLIILQPDLGTAILIGLTGVTAIFLAGLGIRMIIMAIPITLFMGWLFWTFYMLDYQKQRVLTLLNPESDPLGSGYHIIQSKIAIGSGGLFGKGWLNGSQGQLEFLPERQTDFIFAVIGEEFGLLGVTALLLLYLIVLGRGFYIAAIAQDTFSRLMAGCISFTFFFYFFVNTAMVAGLVPVVGVPLPLISAGGTSMVTLLAGFGILMSIQTHRKLLRR